MNDIILRTIKKLSDKSLRNKTGRHLVMTSAQSTSVPDEASGTSFAQRGSLRRLISRVPCLSPRGDPKAAPDVASGTSFPQRVPLRQLTSRVPGLSPRGDPAAAADEASARSFAQRGSLRRLIS